MKKKQPKTVGNISELKVLCKLVEYGFKVSLPYGDNARYDFIVDTGNSLFKIQVKTGYLDKKTIIFPFYRNRLNKGKQIKKFYSKKEVDYFMGYSTFLDRILIFKNDSKLKRSMSIRATKTKYIDYKRGNKEKDYEFKGVFK